MKRLTALVLVLAGCVYYAPLLRSQVPAQGQPGSPITTVPGTVAPPAEGAPTTPAVAVTSVPSPAAPQNPLDQMMWAAAMAYVIQFLKKMPWFTLLTPQTEARTKAVLGFIVATCTAVGIHLVVNGSFFTASGVSLGVTGLSFDAFKDIGFQWLSQQIAYDGLIRKTNPA